MWYVQLLLGTEYETQDGHYSTLIEAVKSTYKNTGFSTDHTDNVKFGKDHDDEFAGGDDNSIPLFILPHNDYVVIAELVGLRIND